MGASNSKVHAIADLLHRHTGKEYDVVPYVKGCNKGLKIVVDGEVLIRYQAPSWELVQQQARAGLDTYLTIVYEETRCAG